MANRLRGRYGYPEDDPFSVTLHPDRLEQPLRWRKPKRIFVCSMGDLFHDEVPHDFVRAVFGVMASAPQHTFMVLTKRPERMLQWVDGVTRGNALPASSRCIGALRKISPSFTKLCDMDQLVENFPLPNVMLGVTAEDQEMADERIPMLLQIPATVRFVSVEPMLEAVDLTTLLGGDLDAIAPLTPFGVELGASNLDWVICGGENGPGARPMDLQWARDLRDQCFDVGVGFFFKGAGKGQETPEDMAIQELPAVRS